MQTLYQNGDNRGSSGEIDVIDIIICTGGLADIQKENILKDIEAEAFEYTIIGEFLMNLKRV